jgi:NAD-dependent SIR2 family protein deacetylase
MANVVFILGAGASADGGAPLMGNFLDVADRLLLSGEVKQKEEHFQTVRSAIGALQAVHSKAQLDLINVESVFNAFVMAKVLGKFPGQGNFSGEKLEKSIKQLIATTLEHTQKFRVQSSTVMPPRSYEAFARLLYDIKNRGLPGRSVAVLTFNYDVGADLALHRLNLGPAYGLDDSDMAERVPLLKLHGSLNWANCTQCRKVVPWHLRDMLAGVSVRTTDSEEIRFDVWSGHFTRFRHCDNAVEHELPFIVPPTWNKSDHHQTIAPVWKRAALELSDAEHIFVIGYSLPETDGFFRTLYALGAVGPSPLKRFHVFNPEPQQGTVDNRFRALLGHAALARYHYYETAFAETIQYIRAMFPMSK